MPALLILLLLLAMLSTTAGLVILAIPVALIAFVVIGANMKAAQRKREEAARAAELEREKAAKKEALEREAAAKKAARVAARGQFFARFRRV